MFNNKYSKVLTIILVILIIGIFGTMGYFAYNMFVISSKNNKAEETVDKFSDATIKREVVDSSDDDGQIDTDLINSINSLQTEQKQEETEKVYMEGYEVMGVIEIPKTSVKLPVLSEVTKKSLETSVAILYGVGLNQPGNTTIVGHNYRNGLFFSDNKKLTEGDTINITDQTGTTVTYSIYNIYLTSPNDASYMQRDTEGAREISLSTCTDDSSQRLIILAKEQQ